MKYWLFLLLAIIAEVIGTSALKTSDGFSRFWPFTPSDEKSPVR